MNHLYQAKRQVIDTRYAIVFSTPYNSARTKKIIRQNMNAEGFVFNMI